MDHPWWNSTVASFGIVCVTIILVAYAIIVAVYRNEANDRTSVSAKVRTTTLDREIELTRMQASLRDRDLKVAQAEIRTQELRLLNAPLSIDEKLKAVNAGDGKADNPDWLAPSNTGVAE